MLEVKNLLGGGKKGIEFFDGGEGVFYYQDTDVPRKVTKIETIINHVVEPDAAEVIISESIGKVICCHDAADRIYVANQAKSGSTYQLSLSRYDASSGNKISDGSPFAVLSNSTHVIIYMKIIADYIYAVNQNGSIYKIDAHKYFRNSSGAVEVLFNNTSYPNALVAGTGWDGEVLIINTGNYLETFSLNGTFNGGVGLGTDAGVHLFVTTLSQMPSRYAVGAKLVKKYSNSGSLEASYDPGENIDANTFSSVKIMAACTNYAYIYISCVSIGKISGTSKRFIEKLDANLNVVQHMDLKGNPSNYDVYTLAVDGDGYIYQYDREGELRKISPDGKGVWDFRPGSSVVNGFFSDYYAGGELDVRYMYYKTTTGNSPVHRLPVARYGGKVAYFED